MTLDSTTAYDAQHICLPGVQLRLQLKSLVWRQGKGTAHCLTGKAGSWPGSPEASLIWRLPPPTLAPAACSPGTADAAVLECDATLNETCQIVGIYPLQHPQHVYMVQLMQTGWKVLQHQVNDVRL